MRVPISCQQSLLSEIVDQAGQSCHVPLTFFLCLIFQKYDEWSDLSQTRAIPIGLVPEILPEVAPFSGSSAI